MKKIILTSALSFVAAEVGHYIEPKKTKTAFIYTAAEVEAGGKDADWNQADRAGLVSIGLDVFDYTLTGKTLTDLERDLASADNLYFSGGNTFYLLQQARKSGLTELIEDFCLRQAKTYIGTSAGSVIAVPRLPEYLLDLGEELIDPNLIDATGFNLVPCTVLPHWGSASFKQRYLESRIELVYKEDQAPLLLLTNNQFVVMEDDNLKLVDVTAHE